MNRLIDLIKHHEGTGPVKNGRLMPYQDSEGYTTIGYGRCIDLVGITEKEADELVRNDIIQTGAECYHNFFWFDELNEPRQAVIISMVFNMGMPKFMGLDGHPGFKKTIKLLEGEHYVAASIEMLDSKWAKQVGQRAIELSNMMKTGKWL